MRKENERTRTNLESPLNTVLWLCSDLAILPSFLRGFHAKSYSKIFMSEMQEYRKH